jgi:hypothetical protein
MGTGTWKLNRWMKWCNAKVTMCMNNISICLVGVFMVPHPLTNNVIEIIWLVIVDSLDSPHPSQLLQWQHYNGYWKKVQSLNSHCGSLPWWEFNECIFFCYTNPYIWFHTSILFFILISYSVQCTYTLFSSAQTLSWFRRMCVGSRHGSNNMVSKRNFAQIQI